MAIPLIGFWRCWLRQSIVAALLLPLSAGSVLAANGLVHFKVDRSTNSEMCRSLGKTLNKEFRALNFAYLSAFTKQLIVNKDIRLRAVSSFYPTSPELEGAQWSYFSTSYFGPARPVLYAYLNVDGSGEESLLIKTYFYIVGDGFPETVYILPPSALTIQEIEARPELLYRLSEVPGARTVDQVGIIRPIRLEGKIYFFTLNADRSRPVDFPFASASVKQYLGGNKYAYTADFKLVCNYFLNQ